MLHGAEEGTGGRAPHPQKASPLEELFAASPSVQAAGVGSIFHGAGITPEGGFADSIL